MEAAHAAAGRAPRVKWPAASEDAVTSVLWASRAPVTIDSAVAVPALASASLETVRMELAFKRCRQRR